MSQAGPVNILNGVDLKIAKGEAVGLVGPSGSGKSTLLMVMSGLERPTSGKVTVGTQELSKFDEDAAARFRRGNVGIVFQSFHLIPTMTALENVAVPLELALVPNAFERAAEELKAVGLAHRMDHYPSQLSGGEQQRVALARAIAPRPSLLFADEPTGNLDGKTGGEIMNLIFALQRERGATLILVTHDEDLVRRCDRIVRLRDGRIDGIETVEQTSAPIPLSGPMSPVVTMAPAPIREPEPEPQAIPVRAAEPAPPEPEPSIETVAIETEATPEPALPEPVIPEPAPTEAAAPESTEPEHASAPPIAAAPPAIEIKPDPELLPEQIESDLGIGIVTPHETVSALEEIEGSATPASESSDVSSASHDYRRVAAGGE